VVPDGAMRAHNDHAINKSGQKSPPIQEEDQEQNKKRCQAQHLQPAKKGKPILPCLKNI
jgi:hypothetical protein